MLRKRYDDEFLRRLAMLKPYEVERRPQRDRSTPYLKENREAIETSNDDGNTERTVEYPPGKEKSYSTRHDQGPSRS